MSDQDYGTTGNKPVSLKQAPQTAVDEDQLEREAIQQEGRSSSEPVEPETFIDWAPDFLPAIDPPIRYLVNELLPERVIALFHGEPRTRKSWTVADIAVALATGTPVFGLDRFAVSAPVRILYSSQEDSAFLVRPRFKALLRGRGIETAVRRSRGLDIAAACGQLRTERLGRRRLPTASDENGQVDVA